MMLPTRATRGGLFPVSETDGTAIALRALRRASGLSVRELAALAHVSSSYLSRVETGDATPTDRWVRDVLSQVGNAIAQKDAA